MSELIRVSGKTVEDAITNATIQLGVTSDHIVYTVIEHESKGFLGIGQKDAMIEVRIKTEADYVAEKLSQNAQNSVKEEPAEEGGEGSVENLRDLSKKESAKEEEIKKVLDEAHEISERRKESEDLIKEMEASTDKTDSEPKKKEREIRPLENPQEAIDKAENFLRDVYGAMKMDVELISTYDGEVLNIQMNGDDMGILIGKRGQTLDSLQYLVSLVVNKGSSTYVRVKLDTENYRERRKATLENLAKNISVKVRKTRQSVYLEPMNPYEGRIIHSALQSDPFVTTHSEGEEPDRKVVVTLRADADLDALDRKYGEKRYRGGRGSYRGSRKGNRRGYSKRHEDGELENTEQMEPVQIPDTGSADTSSLD